jgi:hypothetical protein
MKTSKTDMYALINQIEQYSNLKELWKECVFNQLIPSAVIQIVALVLVECGILYVHNWLAAFLGAVIIGTKIFETLKQLSLNLMYGFMMLQIRDSFVKGLTAGRNEFLTGNTSSAPKLTPKPEETT